MELKKRQRGRATKVIKETDQLAYEETKTTGTLQAAEEKVQGECSTVLQHFRGNEQGRCCSYCSAAATEHAMKPLV